MYTHLILLGLIVTIIRAEQFSYDGYKVYRIQPSKAEHAQLLSELSNNNSHVDFWSSLVQIGRDVDVMVDPDTQHELLDLLERTGITYNVLIDNVESVLEEEQMEKTFALPLETGRINFNNYHRHDQINAYLDHLSQSRSSFVKVETIGKSYEGRDLKLIKISTNPSANKPIIFIDAGIYGREWIAPAQALYVINQLVEVSENAYLLNKVDWHILPVLNPDGYEYTHTTRRFWKKTRSPNTKPGCFGTDLNRNYDYKWDERGVSYNECTNTYKGRIPFSEKENAAHALYINNNKHKIKLYLTLHSYGSSLLFLGEDGKERPKNYKELQALGEMVANTIHKVAGHTYTVGTSAATGRSVGWVKEIGGIELSYAIELPGGGEVGFDPPACKILPIVSETWEGIKAFHYYIYRKFGSK